jgi:hypothetical protein
VVICHRPLIGGALTTSRYEPQSRSSTPIWNPSPPNEVGVKIFDDRSIVVRTAETELSLCFDATAAAGNPRVHQFSVPYDQPGLGYTEASSVMVP